ncbi:MAG: N-acylglucosamine 2-epimerase, partial [Clostridiales bacterium]|nr:N-acylglucosamine 2-epimerase [Clostridiales bacterium]
MSRMRDEMMSELTDHIIPFWKSLKDDAAGGYTGYMDIDLVRDEKAPKGCILNSRILWFFASAAKLLGDESLVPYADHAYRFMTEHCVDRKFGGVYWSCARDGTPLDTTKHTYNQAFAVYALAAYYELTGKEEALSLAREIVNIIETKCRDEGGYLEAYTRDFRPESNEKLSENGVMASRTMNTMLHVFEGYSGLYQACGDGICEARMKEILNIFMDRVY